MQLLAHGAGVLEGVPAGRGLDAARARSNAAFGQDDETARLAGAVQMRAAAKLYGLGVIRLPMVTTRTVSPYFSPKSAIAPMSMAACWPMSLAVNG